MIDIHAIAIFASYFVIVNGTSDRMLAALSEAAVEQVRLEYQVKGRIEGEPQDGWLLVDFGPVILHIFSPDRRNYYRLEELWEDGKVLLRLQ